MKRLAAGLVVLAACSASLLAQEQSRTLERISLALQQPPPLVSRSEPAESPGPTTFGIFTLIPPTGRGEMIRVSVPIGALVSRAFKAAGSAHRQRQERAARRKVQEELDRLTLQQAPLKP